MHFNSQKGNSNFFLLIFHNINYRIIIDFAQLCILIGTVILVSNVCHGPMLFLCLLHMIRDNRNPYNPFFFYTLCNWYVIQLCELMHKNKNNTLCIEVWNILIARTILKCLEGKYLTSQWQGFMHSYTKQKYDGIKAVLVMNKYFFFLSFWKLRHFAGEVNFFRESCNTQYATNLISKHDQWSSFVWGQYGLSS